MKYIIDPHLHFFEINQGHYQWLKEEEAPFWPDKAKLRYSFHEKSLLLDQDSRLAGFVHIEAGFDNARPWREIAWLESSCTLPFNTVAGINLTLEENDFIHQINQLLEYQSVVGCRHILDDDACELLVQKKVQSNLAYLAEKQLSFDLQMPLSNSQAVGLLITILKEHPNLRLIINHAGWPPINTKAAPEDTAWKQWQTGLTALSQFEQCAIKCSGWEMADRHYDTSWQLKVITQCLNAFGDNRVMLASNFPLTLFSQDYKNLWQQYFNLETKVALSQQQVTALTYGNAAYWYKLNV